MKYLLTFACAALLLGAVPASTPVPLSPVPYQPTTMDCSKGCVIFYGSYIMGTTGKRVFEHIHIRSKHPVEVWESTDERD